MAKAKRISEKKTTTATDVTPAAKTEAVSAPTASMSMPLKPAPAAETHRPPPMVMRPSPDEIARRAYEKYRARNGRPGSALEDWTSAERELRGTSA